MSSWNLLDHATRRNRAAGATGPAVEDHRELPGFSTSQRDVNVSGRAKLGYETRALGLGSIRRIDARAAPLVHEKLRHRSRRDLLDAFAQLFLRHAIAPQRVHVLRADDHEDVARAVALGMMRGLEPRGEAAAELLRGP